MRRQKRSSSPDKAIELAVFVDDDLFRQEKKAGISNNDADAAIQDLVFTYLNSVQLLYNSDRLDTKFRILLVKLEVFRSREPGIDKSGGEIEKYLDSFCGWQKAKKLDSQY